MAASFSKGTISHSFVNYDLLDQNSQEQNDFFGQLEIMRVTKSVAKGLARGATRSFPFVALRASAHCAQDDRPPLDAAATGKRDGATRSFAALRMTGRSTVELTSVILLYPMAQRTSAETEVRVGDFLLKRFVFTALEQSVHLWPRWRLQSVYHRATRQ